MEKNLTVRSFTLHHVLLGLSGQEWWRG